MRLFTIFYFITIVVFGGCSTSSSIVEISPKVKLLPTWYLTPPSNTEQFLYGVGDGQNREKAVKSALDSMISKLGITIASSYESNTSLTRGYHEYFNHISYSKIKSKVSKIHISNFEVIEIYQQSYNHYIVLVKSDRDTFLQSLVSSLEQVYKKVRRKYKFIEYADLISRYDFYSSGVKTLNNTIPTLLILSSMSKTFDNRPYLLTIKQIERELDILQNSITFSVTGGVKSKPFIDVIRAGLMNEKLRLTSVNNLDKNHLNINISSIVQELKSYSFDIARVTLMIEVKGQQSKIIGGNKLSLTGQATQGIDVAVDNAAKKLQKQIKMDGIMKVIGVYIEQSSNEML